MERPELVLSSQAHKNAALMSNRLFESVAAGALVICDENPFAKKYFGDSLLYIDSRNSIDEIFADIEAHLAWAKAHPDLALAMIARAQAIFRAEFNLTKNLRDLFSGLGERQAELARHGASAPSDATVAPRAALLSQPPTAAAIPVHMHLLMPDFSAPVLERHLYNAACQQYDALTVTLHIDGGLPAAERARIMAQVAVQPRAIGVAVADYYRAAPRGINERCRTGQVIADILAAAPHADSGAVMLVAPNETLLSNHVATLAASLERNPQAPCAASAVLHRNGAHPVHTVGERIEFRQLSVEEPIGYARFLVRVASVPADRDRFLPYLDRKAMAVLTGGAVIVQEMPSTVIIEVDQHFPVGNWDEGQENELLSALSLTIFEVRRGHAIILPPLTLPAGVPLPRPVKQDRPLGWLIFQTQLIRRDGARARLAALTRKIERKLA